MSETVDKSSAHSKNIFFRLGDLFIFCWKFFRLLVKPPLESNELMRQIFRLGYKSLGLVSVSSLIIGFVMTIHLIPAIRRFGAESLVPSMVVVSIIREIGPVITALVCSGKIASAIGAEIGSMKVTEQIDAMSISGVDPFHFLVVTRVLATSICLPLLIIYSVTIALFGAYLAEFIEAKMSLSLYISSGFDYLFFHDIIPTLVKSFLFGFTIGVVGCYYGYKTVKGASGVGEAAHSSVVTSSFIIFFVDLLVVEIAHLFY